MQLKVDVSAPKIEDSLGEFTTIDDVSARNVLRDHNINGKMGMKIKSTH